MGMYAHSLCLFGTLWCVGVWGSGDVRWKLRKTFHSDAQFQQHIGTKKHKVIALAFEKSGLVADADESIVKVKAPTSSKVPAAGAAAGAAEGDEDGDEDEQDEDELDEDDSLDIPPTTCLFCLLQSTSMEENVQHMTEVHSFYVPCTSPSPQSGGVSPTFFLLFQTVSISPFFFTCDFLPLRGTC
jgi:hypothetical protein